MAKAKKPEPRDLSVNLFNAADLYKGVKEKKKKQRIADEKETKDKFSTNRLDAYTKGCVND